MVSANHLTKDFATIFYDHDGNYTKTDFRVLFLKLHIYIKSQKDELLQI